MLYHMMLIQLIGQLAPASWEPGQQLKQIKPSQLPRRGKEYMSLHSVYGLTFISEQFQAQHRDRES